MRSSPHLGARKLQHHERLPKRLQPVGSVQRLAAGALAACRHIGRGFGGGCRSQKECQTRRVRHRQQAMPCSGVAMRASPQPSTTGPLRLTCNVQRHTLGGRHQLLGRHHLESGCSRAGGSKGAQAWHKIAHERKLAMRPTRASWACAAAAQVNSTSPEARSGPASPGQPAPASGRRHP